MQNTNYASYGEEPFVDPYDSFFVHLLEKSHPQLLRKHYDVVYRSRK